MKISKDGIGITNRFFEAIDMLKEQGKIKGVKTFTDENCINRWNLNTVKWNPEKSVLKPEWIAYLARDYGVSSEWIILGSGNMFARPLKTKTVQKPCK